MRTTIRFLLGFLLLFISGFVSAETSTKPVDPYAALVGRSMAALMAKNNIPGAAVTLYVHGKPYSYQFGYVNNDKKYHVTKYTIFEIGSLTKIMTSLLFTQEIDYARMALTDSILKYIPDLPASKFKNINMQSLATHTSGLPFSLPYHVRSGDDLDNFFARWQPQYAPGREWMYSNTGMGLLGIALENATQMQLNELYVRHILNPLRMQPIGLVVPPKLKIFMAQGYDTNDKPVPHVDLGIFPAAYGVKLSASDMEKFLGAAIGLPGTPERVLYPMLMTEQAFVKLPDIQQGLAWHISPLPAANFSELEPARVDRVIDRPTYTPRVLIEQTGTTQGFKSYMAVIPYKKSGISILTNKSVANSAIVNAARNILLRVNGLG